MTKIRTIEDLQTVLDSELAWRKKELATIKGLVTTKSSRDVTNFYLRSGIALTYAHWEGFIKVAGDAYLTYISSQRLPYSALTMNFSALATKKIMNAASSSNKVTAYTKITEFFTIGVNNRCSFSSEIETKSNLSSEVLKEITYILNIDYRDYETKANLIDERLLKNRNGVAHGKYLLIDVDEFIELHTTIVELLDLFANQISNAAYTKAYKRTADPL
ncbi:MAE_28990/MAE_18760 family HEPN-like nuclease [Dictyobacter aurantiacus]|uniref:MAE-28990/MAE-18760-like HEPN domain-containing protein n=1 Tax=Dictyobacter aurantiacus TaxID=1936993 RepID=A0A401ZAQ8_9CHLR|nr:MAE_28990/MAE_18760 family HEPN-like nuclease [Dictyobacter aurantiacus]GCE03960.1 hypothetical protein KDAU_12890 [Dictyobacter aurantiacus]